MDADLERSTPRSYTTKHCRPARLAPLVRKLVLVNGFIRSGSAPAGGELSMVLPSGGGRARGGPPKGSRQRSSPMAAPVIADRHQAAVTTAQRRALRARRYYIRCTKLISRAASKIEVLQLHFACSDCHLPLKPGGFLAVTIPPRACACRYVSSTISARVGSNVAECRHAQGKRVSHRCEHGFSIIIPTTQMERRRRMVAGNRTTLKDERSPGPAGSFLAPTAIVRVGDGCTGNR